MHFLTIFDRLNKQHQLEALIAALYNKKMLAELKAKTESYMEKLGYTEDQKDFCFKNIKGDYKQRKELFTYLVERLETLASNRGIRV